LGKIPVALPAEVHTAAEQTLGQQAREHTPAELGVLGQQLLARVDPDGELTEPADRARQRQLWLGRQDAQQMSVIKGRLDPATRAMFDVVLASWAAKGVNNPDDEHSPHGSVHDAAPDVVEAAAQRDTRTTAQRQHDAFRALLHAALDGGLLGKSHRGLPPQLIVSITSQELREQAGLGRTATGTTLPIGDVVEVAARAQQYLAVYADHSSEILYFGQARRFASRGQRLALADSYGGCSHPDCSAPMVHVEIHHAARDYARGGNTDIHDLAPACGVHNRMVGPDTGQYTTELIAVAPTPDASAGDSTPNPDSHRIRCGSTDSFGSIGRFGPRSNTSETRPAYRPTRPHHRYRGAKPASIPGYSESCTAKPTANTATDGQIHTITHHPVSAHPGWVHPGW
ncbi:HNH endonuclease signature motif containing protein, partial [Gordonia sp. i37]|uniref:HNH endonuclease signature motif containing protein n=1 Tax=Gordonia sp. i37 TaxID=1961707 RepID=UPI00209AC99A